MTATPEQPQISGPHDILALLRAHAEEYWLVYHVLPVLSELERPRSIPEDQLGAALAYLEVLWLDSCRRAAETDAAYDRLAPAEAQPDRLLYEKARRYHAAVRRLRVATGHRVARRTRLPDDAFGHRHAHR